MQDLMLSCVFFKGCWLQGSFLFFFMSLLEACRMGGYTQISLAAFLVQVITRSGEARDRMTGPNSTHLKGL